MLLEFLKDLQINQPSQPKAVFLKRDELLPDSRSLSQNSILESLKNSEVKLKDSANLFDNPGWAFIGSAHYLYKNVSEFPGDIELEFDRFCDWMDW